MALPTTISIAPFQSTSTGSLTELRPSSHVRIAAPPARMYLFGRPAPGWRFQYPMAVTIEREDDGTCLAVDELFGNYGQGASVDEAVVDLKIALTEYYGVMAGSADEPSRSVFEHLRTYLDREPL